MTLSQRALSLVTIYPTYWFSTNWFHTVDEFLRTMLKGGENILMDFVITLHPNLKSMLETENETLDACQSCGKQNRDLLVCQEN